MPARSSAPTPETLKELDRALAEIAAATAVEVREGGERFPEFQHFEFEIRHGVRTLLHLWSAGRNLTRRVLRISEQSPGHLVLEVERFGRARPSKLEFTSVDAPRSEARMAREKFCMRLGEILAEQFPDDEIESLTVAPDLEHSFSGLYPRGVQITRGNRSHHWAVLACSTEETAATAEAAMSFGLLWLDWRRQHTRGAAVQGLRLLMPGSGIQGAVRRLQGLAPAAHVELYELDQKRRRIQEVDAQDTGNRDAWLEPRRLVQQVLGAAHEQIEKICALAPGAIDVVVPPGSQEAAFRFRGLEFARWKEGRILCGLPDHAEFRADSVEELVRQLDAARQPHAFDTKNPLYRAQPERWLESLALREIARIDAHLDPRHVYRQVPASSLADRGVIDLLGVTLDGRLAVIELKASEDIHLPLQGLDYWLRVREQHAQRAFPAAGYFTGVELQDALPLLYLVAPGFRFHPSTDTILRYFNAEIEVRRVGLNEQWRKELRVVFRM